MGLCNFLITSRMYTTVITLQISEKHVKSIDQTSSSCKNLHPIW